MEKEREPHSVFERGVAVRMGGRDRALGRPHAWLRDEVSAADQPRIDFQHQRTVIPWLPGAASLSGERLAKKPGIVLLRDR